MREAPLRAANAAGRPWRGGLRLLRGALLALLALLATPAFAQTFPKFTGLVVDAANILPADRKAALEQKLQAFQRQTQRQLVVATIPDLQGYSKEDYGYRLGRAWGVGLRNADNGVILFIAPNEPAGHRAIRIEAGRRLEPFLTDAWSSVIINTRMMPLLKAGDVPGALDAGAQAIIDQLNLPDDQARAQATAAARQFDATHRRGSADGLPLGLIFWVLVIGFVLLAMVRRGSAGRRYQDVSSGGGGSSWPIWLWAAGEMFGGDRRDGGGWGGGSGDGGMSGGGADGSWGGGGFTGGGGGDFGGGGASGEW